MCDVVDAKDSPIDYWHVRIYFLIIYPLLNKAYCFVCALFLFVFITKSSNPALPTLRSLIDNAKTLLSCGEFPFPLGREKKLKEIMKLIYNNLITLGEGSCGVQVSTAAEGPTIISNLYVCGLAGIGKTLSVEKVLRCLLADQNARHPKFNGGYFGDIDDAISTLENLQNDSTSATTSSSSSSSSINSSNDLSSAYPKFRIVTISGPAMSTTDFYKVLADKLDMEAVVGGEAAAKSAVMELLTNYKECSRRSNSKFEREPVVILMVDEIDKAPRGQILELLKIAPTAVQQYETSLSTCASKSPKTFQPWACNLIIVGLANTMDIQKNLGITGASYHYISEIVFEPYKPEQLKTILRSRTLGLFEKRAVDMLSLKIYAAKSELFNWT